MNDNSNFDKRSGPPWRGAHWIPVIVISVILLFGHLPPDEDGAFVTALLGALGFGFGTGGAGGRLPPLSV